MDWPFLGAEALAEVQFQSARCAPSMNPSIRARRDIDRYTALLDLGWTIIRVSSDLLRYRRALSSPGSLRQCALPGGDPDRQE
jgi:hypothetical protein